MSKPRGLRWLEEQTGAAIPFDESATPRGRHLSVRLDGDLAAAVDAAAQFRGVAVSEFVRAVLAASVESDRAVRGSDADALMRRIEDDLAEVRRRLAG